MKKLIAIFECLLPSIVALGIQTIVYLILTLIYPLVFGQTKLTEEVSRYLSILAVVISGVFFALQYHKSSKHRLNGGNSKRYIMNNMILIGVMGIAGQLFIAGTMTLISPFFIRIFSDYAKTIDSINTGHPLVVMIHVIIIAPIVEELIFRWSILEKASHVLPFIGANILQAAAFGIFHGNLVQGFFTFLLGLLLGVVYHKYQNILAPIFLHMIFNGSTYLVRLLSVGVKGLIMMTIIGGVTTGITLWFMYKNEGEKISSD